LIHLSPLSPERDEFFAMFERCVKQDNVPAIPVLTQAAPPPAAKPEEKEAEKKEEKQEEMKEDEKKD
jgi:ribosomal protein L12E/L44/L45/RPP1/RPP2